MKVNILKENDVLKINDNAIVRREKDKYMVINIATQGLHFISPIAYSVVESINGESNLEEIISKFVETYNVNKDEARNNIVKFIEDLIDRKLIVIKTS